MDRFLAMTIFTRVVEKKSFVRAAESLDLSPAAVTGHVKALERRLNSKLLQRTTRRLALTEEGAVYFEQCRRILAQVDEADAMLASQRLSPKGTLRVMTPSLLATLVIIPRLPEFLDRYPDLRVELQIAAQAPDFVAQNIDVALQLSMQPDPRVVFRPFGLCAVRTVATARYLERHGHPRTPEDLAGHHLIGVRPAPGNLLSLMRFERDGRMFAYDARCRFVADAGDAQRAAGLAHLGIFQGYQYTVADLVASGELVPVLEDWMWTGPPLAATYLPNLFVPPKVQVFLEFARALLADKIAPYREDWVR